MSLNHYAVFLDLDRTLMCGNIVPQLNIDTIQQAREQGHFVFVNTARSYAYIPEHIHSCDYLDGFVAGIGTDLRFRGEQIFSHAVSTDEVINILCHFIGDDREVCLEGEDHVLWVNPQRPSAKNGTILHSCDEYADHFSNCRISKFYIGGSITEAEKQWLENDYLVFCHPDYTEFVSKGFGKGRGLQRMMHYLGLPMHNSIAMGDSANDTDMLQAAAISVAMGNAIPEIKAMCHMVSDNAKDGGVAIALQKLLSLR